MRVDEAPIESPCEEDLDRMRLGPGGLDRYCDRCEKSVHDLSAMGPERARAFLATHRGPICISYISDHRGELLFEPTHAPARPKSDFVPLARLAQAATLAASLAACTPHGDDLSPQVQESAPLLEVRDAPVVIPNQAPPPIQPEPAIEEPCEPEPRPARDRVPIKGKRKTAGVYVSDLDDRLGLR